MKMTKDMPWIRDCSITECTYNNDRHCHAHAITVGDGDNPGCDTFFHCGRHCHSSEDAGVGACKVSSCSHNVDFECRSESIQMGWKHERVQCLNFTHR